MVNVIDVVLLSALIISLYYNYRFAINLLNVTEAIEKSLDKLDEKYASVSKILEIPVMYDSPQVRAVIKEIKEARNAILEVANEISVIEVVEDGETKEN